MLVVALTGGIGSGKSTVADRFSELGVPVIDTDLIARELVASGSSVLSQIAAAFGAEMLTPTGELDRERLRQRVFDDPEARRRLESIMHPPILARVRERLARLHAPYALVVIPLLLETGQTGIADRILVVDAPESVQLQRVRNRNGLSEAQIGKIMAAQAQRPDRLALADDLIDNRGDLRALIAQVEALHHRYLLLAEGG